MLTKVRVLLGIVVVFVLAAIVAATAYSATSGRTETVHRAASVEGTVYFLFPNVTTTRFRTFDQPNFIAAFKKYAPSVKLKFLSGNNSVNQQLAQVDAALANNAKAILLVAVDPKQAGGEIQKANQAHVPIVTFAYDAINAKATYHVTVPFVDIGVDHGKYLTAHLPAVTRPVRLALMLGDPAYTFYGDQMRGLNRYLTPLINAGTIKIVCQADALLYLPANAQKNMEQCLTKTNNGVDAVYVMNDDTGGGVEAALQAQQLQDKVKIVGGYDATTEAIQRILLGWQTATMSPPYKAMDTAAVRLLISAIRKTPPPRGIINGRWNNHVTKGGTPAAFIPNVFITRANLQKTVIDAGLHTKQEICTGIAAKTSFCAG